MHCGQTGAVDRVRIPGEVLGMMAADRSGAKQQKWKQGLCTKVRQNQNCGTQSVFHGTQSHQDQGRAVSYVVEMKKEGKK